MNAPVPSDTHNRLLARGVLDAIELTQLVHEVAPTFRGVPENERELALAGELIGHEYHAAEGTVVLVFAWEVTVRHAGVDVLQITARYAIAYGNLYEERAEEVVPVFGRIGRFAVYAYFRALVSTLLGQANIVLPILPVLREGGANAATPGKPSILNTPVDLVAPVVGGQSPKSKTSRGRRKAST